MGSERPAPPIFEERLTGWLAPDAVRIAVPLLLAGVLGLALGFGVLGVLALGLGAFVTAFFRNPPRQIPPGERSVVAPADGRVIARRRDRSGRAERRRCASASSCPCSTCT